jgi:hexulose-6-phosphate isomerase
LKKSWEFLDLIHDIGFVQGRLLPQSSRGYQVFPSENWFLEFSLAEERRLTHIEWVIDSFTFLDNPILTQTRDVLELAKSTNIIVKVLCLDFLMDFQVLGLDLVSTVAKRYCELANESQIAFLLFPFVDRSSILRGNFSSRVASELLIDCASLLTNGTTKIMVEADLPPEQFAEWLGQLGIKEILVNYDIGNSASLGYDFRQEFEAYGALIAGLHIKDRYLFGGPAKLGQGNADWTGALKAWAAFRSSEGLTTMQTYRDLQGVKVFDEQLALVRKVLREA